MNLIKFSVVDILRCKTQLWVMVSLSALAFLFMKTSISPLNGIIYMCFGAIILSTQPFMQEQIAESGFINMFPTTKTERVIGRYLFGLIMILIAMLLSIVVILVYGMINNNLPSNWYIAVAGCFGIGLVILSIQYLVFYAMGKMKSQLFESLLMMAPGFILFFGANFIIGKLGTAIPIVINWIANNQNIFTILVVCGGIAVWGMSIIVSSKIVEKRDFI